MQVNPPRNLMLTDTAAQPSLNCTDRLLRGHLNSLVTSKTKLSGDEMCIYGSFCQSTTEDGRKTARKQDVSQYDGTKYTRILYAVVIGLNKQYSCLDKINSTELMGCKLEYRNESSLGDVRCLAIW